MLNAKYRNIILWRHAHALPLDNHIHSDLERPLSKQGKKQADEMAGWLKRYLPEDTVIISSNALRATQTADALTHQYMQHTSLAPETSLAAVIAALNTMALEKEQAQTHVEHVLIVGHQPWLGLLAAQLLSLPDKLAANAKKISMEKGAVWWFKRTQPEIDPAFKLITVQSTNLL